MRYIQVVDTLPPDVPARFTHQMNHAVARRKAPATIEVVVDREGATYEGASGLPPQRDLAVAS